MNNIIPTEDGFIEVGTALGAQVGKYSDQGYHLVSHDFATMVSVYRRDYFRG